MRRNAWKPLFGLLAALMLSLPCVATALDAGAADLPNVLSRADMKATKAQLKAARDGKQPNLKQVPELLHGHVRAAWLLSDGHRASAAQLNDWLRNHPELAVAGEIHSLAEARRERPREVCKTRTITPKATEKNPKPKPAKKRMCSMEGKWGPETPKTAAMLAREARREAVEASQNARRNQLSPAGRELAGKVWKLRTARNHDEALKTLLASGARGALGDAWWQEELVRLTDFWHAKAEWRKVYRAASAAAKARGPQRDEALWQAGFASYRLGQRGEAAGFWSTLVREEPVRGKHYARAAWWAARVFEDLGQRGDAREMWQAAAKQPLSFYGQLALEKLGRDIPIDFAQPELNADGLQAVLQHPRARRGLALAELGETEWAEAELRSAVDGLPPSATQALAAIAVQMELPSLALRAGRDLYDEGITVGAALFPLTPWAPKGGWKADKAFVYGIMRQESAFQPTIGSRVGARGLMQIMPATGRYIAKMTGRAYNGERDLRDPHTNLAMAQDYLAYLGGKLDGSKLLVTAAYNGGIGNVQRWIARGTTPDSDPILWMESIPFNETRDYVEKVMANTWIYEARFGRAGGSRKVLAASDWPQL